MSKSRTGIRPPFQNSRPREAATGSTKEGMSSRCEKKRRCVSFGKTETVILETKFQRLRSNLERRQFSYDCLSFQICCHIQEIPENGADVHHLPAIHRSSVIVGGEPTPLVEKLLDWFSWHDWGVSWSPDTDEGKKHRATVELKQDFKVFGDLKLFSCDVSSAC